MHILHINDSLERGGAETLLVNTVQAIAHLHPEIKQTVITLYDKGELKQQIISLATYKSLDFNLFNPLPAIKKLKKIIKEGRVSVVHSHLLHSTLVSRLAVPKSVGLVTTYHSVFYEPTMVTYARKERYLDKLTYRKRYFSLFVSGAVRENIIKAVGIKDHEQVMMNFASTSFQPLYTFNPEATLKIVMVGNLHEIKNHAIAIKALGQLSHLPIQLDIYGEGSLRGYLQDLIQTNGASVTLKGAMAMTSEVLSQYDLYMMTSLHEGMPISLLEVMQTGLPSLLNDVSMLRETAGDAAVFYEYNSLSDLVVKIESVFNNKSILREFSRQALIQSRKYSANNFIQRLLGIYQKLITENN
ncbi:glycosyltransferase family 4 protein [Rufibacter soli]